MIRKVLFYSLLFVSYLSFAVEDSGGVKSYYDGPYLFFEEKNMLRTVWVSEGQLFEKEFSSKEQIEFQEPSLPSIVIPEKAKWTSKPKGKYKTDEKVVAISDVHGQYEIFEKLLSRHDIIDESNNWSFGEGHLVIVGDVMDRGDQVMECLWLIHKLEKEAEEAGGKVHFLLGNHELMVMNGILDYIHPKYRYTSALLKTPYNLFFSENTALGKWLSSKNVMLQINDVLYVHGGISQQTMSLELGLDEINNVFKRNIYYEDRASIEKDPKLFTLYYGDGPLWYRGYAYPYTFNKESIDLTLDKLKLKTIVVGHTSLPEVKGLYGNKIVLIDSSIKYGESGQLFINEQGEYSVGNFDGSKDILISEEAKTEDRQSLFDFLYGTNEVVINVSHELKEIEKNFEKDMETEGQITIFADKEQYTFSSMFKPGGKSRRKICRMPPLKMNLKKGELETFNFLRDNDKMKIVFQCQTSKSMAESIKKEKFIYDLYSLVSPYGFRAKLVKVKIGDNNKYVDGFVIESDEDIQMRQGIEILKNKTIAPQVVNREEYIKMVLFQFMISNSDWSARKGHNTDLFKRNADNSLIIIPYDFDYCGLIDNDYAVAPENLPINNVTDRYFMDKTISMEELESGIDYFVNIESDVYTMMDEATYLSEGSIKRMKKFVEGFYKIIKDQKKVKRLLKK